MAQGGVACWACAIDGAFRCVHAKWRDSVKLLTLEEDRAEVGGEDHQTVRSKREATDEMHVDSEEDSLQAALKNFWNQVRSWRSWMSLTTLNSWNSRIRTSRNRKQHAIPIETRVSKDGKITRTYEISSRGQLNSSTIVLGA